MNNFRRSKKPVHDNTMSKEWVFTWNNYSQDVVDKLQSLNPPDIVYLVCGKEVGESGTPHLQGTIVFPHRKRRKSVRKLIGDCFLEPVDMISNSIEYCKKDNDYFEKGCPEEIKDKKQGKRSDIDKFKDDVKAGHYDLDYHREFNSSFYASAPQFCKEYIKDNRPKVDVTLFPLREWQQKLYNELIQEPDGRKIKFIVDLEGNKGKSWFARYYCGLHKNAQVILPGKKADMAHAARDDVKVFFFDCPRSKQGDFIQYDLLEELKNGYFFKPKFYSEYVTINTPHVVVLMNEKPDMSKLSQDRFEITILN